MVGGTLTYRDQINTPSPNPLSPANQIYQQSQTPSPNYMMQQGYQFQQISNLQPMQQQNHHQINSPNFLNVQFQPISPQMNTQTFEETYFTNNLNTLPPMSSSSIERVVNTTLEAPNNQTETTHTGFSGLILDMDTNQFNSGDIRDVLNTLQTENMTDSFNQSLNLNDANDKL